MRVSRAATQSKAGDSLEGLSGAVGELRDYLTEEVLDHIPQGLADFLVRCSILETVEPRTASMLDGGSRDNSVRMIREADDWACSLRQISRACITSCLSSRTISSHDLLEKLDPTGSATSTWPSGSFLPQRIGGCLHITIARRGHPSWPVMSSKAPSARSSGVDSIGRRLTCSQALTRSPLSARFCGPVSFCRLEQPRRLAVPL